MLVQNQHSFPGTGCSLAIAKGLDTANMYAKRGMKCAIILYDYSNAFCTFSHEKTMEVAKKFINNDSILDLLEVYLQQSTTNIKISDKNGFFISEKSTTNRGLPQGQIGADIVFAFINNIIQPKPYDGVESNPQKYVDDLIDVMGARNASDIFSCLAANEKLMLQISTALGLKLNDNKTTFIPINLTEAEISDAPYDVAKSPAILKFQFEVKKRPYKGIYLTTNFAIDKLKKRLNDCIPSIAASRKVEPNLMFRLNAASNLVWSCLERLGSVYVYNTESRFQEIEVCIKKVIRAAGLGHMTHSESVYYLSLGMYPHQIAQRQVIADGLKMFNIDATIRNRYHVRLEKFDEDCPIKYLAITLFNKFDYETRKFVIENFKKSGNSEPVKNRIKYHYSQEFIRLNPELKDIEKSDLAFRNRYQKYCPDATKGIKRECAVSPKSDNIKKVKFSLDPSKQTLDIKNISRKRTRSTNIENMPCEKKQKMSKSAHTQQSKRILQTSVAQPALAPVYPALPGYPTYSYHVAISTPHATNTASGSKCRVKDSRKQKPMPNKNSTKAKPAEHHQSKTSMSKTSDSKDIQDIFSEHDVCSPEIEIFRKSELCPLSGHQSDFLKIPTIDKNVNFGYLKNLRISPKKSNQFNFVVEETNWKEGNALRKFWSFLQDDVLPKEGCHAQAIIPQDIAIFGNDEPSNFDFEIAVKPFTMNHTVKGLCVDLITIAKLQSSTSVNDNFVIQYHSCVSALKELVLKLNDGFKPETIILISDRDISVFARSVLSGVFDLIKRRNLIQFCRLNRLRPPEWYFFILLFEYIDDLCD